MCKQLADWQGVHDVSDEQLAETVRVDPTTLKRAKKGKTLLSLETQIAIREASEGYVQLSHWAEHFEATKSVRDAFRRSRREREAASADAA